MALRRRQSTRCIRRCDKLLMCISANVSGDFPRKGSRIGAPPIQLVTHRNIPGEGPIFKVPVCGNNFFYGTPLMLLTISSVPHLSISPSVWWSAKLHHGTWLALGSCLRGGRRDNLVVCSKSLHNYHTVIPDADMRGQTVCWRLLDGGHHAFNIYREHQMETQIIRWAPLPVPPFISHPPSLPPPPGDSAQSIY